MRRAAWILLYAVLVPLHVVVPLVRPLHLDTLLTGGKMLLAWPELWADLQANPYPPLYYVLLKAYTSVAGTSVPALLAPGMLAALATPAALAWALRPAVRDAWLRFLAAALAGAHPLLMLYGSGYAKFYAPMWLVMVAGAGLYLRRRWWWFGACAVLASQLGVQGLFLPLVALGHALLARDGRRPALLAFTASAGLAAVWLVRAAPRMTERVGLHWLHARDLETLGRQVAGDWHWLALGHLRPSLFGATGFEQVACVVLIVAALVLARVLGRGKDRTLLRLAILVPLAAYLVLDRLTPVYYIRYVAVVLFPAAVFCAAGVRALQQRAPVLGWLLLALLLGGRAWGFAALGDEPIVRDWRDQDVAARVVAEREGATLVVMDGFGWTEVWRPYAVSPQPAVPMAFVGGWYTPEPAAEFAAALEGHDRVLLAGYEAPVPPPGWRVERVFDEWSHFNEWNGVRMVTPRFALLVRDESPLEWGVYQIHWGARRFEPVLARALEPFASKPDYVMFYRDLGRPFPKRSAEIIRSHGATPIFSLELWHWGRGDRALPAIAAGRYDDFFRAWARAAKEDGQRVLFRFGFEMNGNWFTWSGQPKLFIEAWRRVHGIFAEEGATHVEWVWAPNVLGVPKTPENDMHLYYPGDDVVDGVGVDGYNFGDDHDEWHTWASMEKVFAGVLPEFAKRYPEKPLMIAETGCAPGEREARARWFHEAHAYLRTQRQVKAVVFFNYDKTREKEPNFRIDATPGALDAFNATFARPRR